MVDLNPQIVSYGVIPGKISYRFCSITPILDAFLIADFKRKSELVHYDLIPDSLLLVVFWFYMNLTLQYGTIKGNGRKEKRCGKGNDGRAR